MSSFQMLQEHWTDEGSAVVVTADTTVINQLLQDLDLPDESPVTISKDRFALAFWGEQLRNYVAWRDGVSACSNGECGGVRAG